jgi:hypothetical protein
MGEIDTKKAKNRAIKLPNLSRIHSISIRYEFASNLLCCCYGKFALK